MNIFADKFLAGSLGVTVGGVDKIPACLDKGIEHFAAGFFVGSPAPLFTKRHRTEAQLRNSQAASPEQFVAHSTLL